jgi:hypothetical protein
MPLRDHHWSAVSLDRFSWSSFFSTWPTLLLMDLNRHMPNRYAGGPRVYTAGSSDSDSPQFTFDPEARAQLPAEAWSPEPPSWSGTSPRPDQDRYCVRVRDCQLHRNVASIELVSPTHGRTPSSRKAFVARCADLLRDGFSVTVVDVVGGAVSLHEELMRFLELAEFWSSAPTSPTFAATYRWMHNHKLGRLETWTYPLSVGQPLPAVPVWLAYDIAIPLELDASYERTCELLRYE